MILDVKRRKRYFVADNCVRFEFLKHDFRRDGIDASYGDGGFLAVHIVHRDVLAESGLERAELVLDGLARFVGERDFRALDLGKREALAELDREVGFLKSRGVAARSERARKRRGRE